MSTRLTLPSLRVRLAVSWRPNHKSHTDSSRSKQQLSEPGKLSTPKVNDVDVSPTSRDDLAGAYRDSVSNQGSEGAGHLALYDSCRGGLYHFHSIGVDVRRLDIQDDYPEGTPLDASSKFDSRLLNLFEEMSRKDPLQKRMADDFVRLKNQLGRRPWRDETLSREGLAAVPCVR